jgi:hypothetical protein
MGWTQRGAHLLLQVRTRVLDEEWENTFRRWYPAFRPEGQPRPRKRPDPWNLPLSSIKQAWRNGVDAMLTPPTKDLNEMARVRVAGSQHDLDKAARGFADAMGTLARAAGVTLAALAETAKALFPLEPIGYLASKLLSVPCTGKSREEPPTHSW